VARAACSVDQGHGTSDEDGRTGGQSGRPVQAVAALSPSARPPPLTGWPGEKPTASGSEVVIKDHDADFAPHVLDDVAVRRRFADGVRAVARAL